MPWTRKFTSPISLRDGRIIATLADARQFMLDLPARHQRNADWRRVAKLLLDASRKQSAVTESELCLKIALEAEGFI